MRELFASFWLAMRRWPLYAGLAVLGLGLFAWAGLGSHRLLGDDNESSDTELAGAPRTGGHGGYVHGFNHK
jgi:hypothetical protein